MFKYSIISYVNNRVTNERISIGLLFINNDTAKIRFSDSKMKFVKTLNEKGYNLLNLSIQEWVKHKFLPDRVPYEQGIIDFSELKIFNHDLTDEVFEQYFSKWIENK